METVAVARNAMATRFEIVLHGDDPVRLRAAGEEALEEIDRLEAQLSLYRPTSQISHVNAGAALAPVRVEPTVFKLLQDACRLGRETGGAFDITIAPLMRCWGFIGSTGRLPAPEDLAEARAQVGLDLVELKDDDFTVRFRRKGVMLDLGAIGKGYALDRAAEVLRELGVTSALLHGGTSTAYGLGTQPGDVPWKVSVPHPTDGAAEFGDPPASPETAGTSAGGPLAVVPLRDESLSVSAVWGRAFEADSRRYGHVIDPRAGAPVAGAVMAAVVASSATETDALSTALLTLGIDGLETISRLRAGARALVVEPVAEPNGFRVESRGIPIHVWNLPACSARSGPASKA